MRRPHIETNAEGVSKFYPDRNSAIKRFRRFKRRCGVLAAESERAGTDHLRTPGLGYPGRTQQAGFLREGFAATGGAGFSEIAKAVRQ